MDLIYTNPAREDVGVLLDYEFDLAFGADENDFECKVQMGSYKMEQGSFLYIEGTEYGGVVDGVELDTEEQTATYWGRTWHGILAGNVIEPEPGYDYFVANGDANAIIADLIERLDLSSVFTANTEESGFQVVNYSFNRYINAYWGLQKMLTEYGAKLKMEYKRDTVVLSAVPLTDYSRDEEFDSSQVDFVIDKNMRPVNHLICLGSGSLRNRYVIHLFADENGGIQPYATTDKPVGDEDYILDKSMQVLFGVDEVADVYDYSSAQTTENFIRLEEQPADWAANYATYFTLDETGNYVNVQGVPDQVGTALTEQPEDWEDKYSKYYYLTEDGVYKTVEAVTTDNYKMQAEKPVDWEQNFSNYFTYYHDGVEEFWTAVSRVAVTKLIPQTTQPSDWEWNYKNYYDMADREHVRPAIDRFGYEYAPEWYPRRYGTAKIYYEAPKWSQFTYYTLNSTVGAPAFEVGKYFIVQDVLLNPPFASKKYFVKKLDHYAEMLIGGLEKMKEHGYCDSLSIDLGLEGIYDIGDIVGATEHTSGIAVWQPITKKIVSINNNKETVNYEIGVI